jgi:hypothetical protein
MGYTHKWKSLEARFENDRPRFSALQTATFQISPTFAWKFRVGEITDPGPTLSVTLSMSDQRSGTQKTQTVRDIQDSLEKIKGRAYGRQSFDFARWRVRSRGPVTASILRWARRGGG